MCNQQEKNCIHNLNRCAIALASLVAMLIDGINTANCLYLVSAIAWLFLPECDTMEARLFDKLRASARQTTRTTGG